MRPDRHGGAGRRDGGLRPWVVVVGLCVGAAGVGGAAGADFSFYGRSGDAVLLDFSRQPGVGTGAVFGDLLLTAFGSHRALRADQLGGPAFAQSGQLYAFANNALGAGPIGGRGGDQDPDAAGFQGTISGSVVIDGMPRTFEVTFQPGYSGVGRGAVGQSLERLNGAGNNPLFVAQQQQRLGYLGFERSGGGLPGVTGVFDSATDEALRTFQAAIIGGLNTTQANVDGIIGPNTAGWLNAANAPAWERLIDPDPQTPGTFSVGSMIGDFDILPGRDPGTGARTGLTPQFEDHATSWMIDLVFAGSSAARAATGRTQLVNAMSASDGYGSAGAHSTHRAGMDLDLHVDASTWDFGNGVLDTEELKVVQHARAFLDLTGLDARVVRILTSNDDILDAINASHPGRAVFDSTGVHLNHLHIDIAPTGRVAGVPDLVGDFNLDDAVDADDIDLLYRNLGGDGGVYNLIGPVTVVDFNDVAVLVGSVLGTTFGDADLDGFVAQADLDAVLLSWGRSGVGWAGGDFNGNGLVEQGDLDAVLLGWGSGAEPGFVASGAQAVPEPGVLAPLLGVILMRRRGGGSWPRRA